MPQPRNKVRNWTSYEYNWLLRNGFDPFSSELRTTEEPVEYIVGLAEFKDRKFVVNKHTLIPRIETELLADLVITELLQHQEPHFIELATGSGALGITIALGLSGKNYQGILSDISSECIEAAKSNWQRLAKQSELTQLTILKSDLLTSINSDYEVDVVVANLPYIPSEQIPALSTAVKDYEPKLALDGGSDGLVLIRRLLIDEFSLLQKLLKKDGSVWLEVDESHVNTAEFTGWNIEILKDYRGQVRYWHCKMC